MPIEVAFSLPGLTPATSGDGSPELRIELSERDALLHRWQSDLPVTEVWRTVFPEGDLVTVLERSDGAQLITFGDVATYLLSGDTTELVCAPADDADVRWKRFLLDTVLWWASSTRGAVLLHSSALSGPFGVVAIASVSGGGKTTLALELLRRGWGLVADDVLALTQAGETVVGHPATRLMNAPLATSDLDALGSTIAILGDEAWLEVPGTPDHPTELRAIILYRRDSADSISIAPIPASVLDLLPHVWDARDGSARARDRFELLANLVATTPVLELSAPPESTPAATADTIEGALRSLNDGGRRSGQDLRPVPCLPSLDNHSHPSESASLRFVRTPRPSPPDR